MAIAIAPSDTTVELVQMTPTRAVELLGFNTNNRHIRPTVVARYARDMAAGDWVLNGETIKVSLDGRVIDGQHRLQAVVESGAVVNMFVVVGLPEDAQETVDRGLPRNIADALRLRGETNVNLLAGAVAQSIVLRSDTPTSTANYWPSSREAIHYLDAHPGMRESVKVGERVGKATRYPASTAAALHHLFASLDEEDADTFWARVVDGADLASDSPILRLREFLLRELAAQRRTTRTRLQALTIKTWNTWRRGDAMLLLKWRTGGSTPEAFPVPE